MRTFLIGCSLLASVVVVGACRGSTPTTPSGSSGPFTYTGSIQDTIAGTGSLTIGLGTSAGITSGTWTMSFSGALAGQTSVQSG